MKTMPFDPPHHNREVLKDPLRSRIYNKKRWVYIVVLEELEM